MEEDFDWFEGGGSAEELCPQWEPSLAELVAAERLDQASHARRLLESIWHRESRATALAAERFAFLDELRLEAEERTGATWTDPDCLAWRDLRAEVAAVLSVHERTAQTLLDLARRLVHEFPATLEALHRALLSERHARIVVEQSAGLPVELLRDYEERLLPLARDLVPSRFEAKAAQIRAGLAPEALAARHREAVLSRRTAVERAPDGMAWYGAYLSAEDAIGAAAAVTGIAKTLMVDGEPRSLAQVEADVFRDLLVDAAGVTLPAEDSAGPVPTPGARRGVRPEVLLHVPALTAIGRDPAPGYLEGYGPIDPETARRLAGCATGFVRILSDPETGAALSFGRTVYRVPAELRRYLQVRDEVCRFVGCTRSARHCDIDHSVPWAEDGETVVANLAHLCRGHHRLKGAGRWRLDQSGGGDGTLTWTSPLGRTYTSRPAVKLPPSRGPSPGSPPMPMTEWLPSEDVPPF